MRRRGFLKALIGAALAYISLPERVGAVPVLKPPQGLDGLFKEIYTTPTRRLLLDSSELMRRLEKNSD